MARIQIPPRDAELWGHTYFDQQAKKNIDGHNKNATPQDEVQVIPAELFDRVILHPSTVMAHNEVSKGDGAAVRTSIAFQH